MRITINKRNGLIAVAVLLVIGVAAYFLLHRGQSGMPPGGFPTAVIAAKVTPESLTDEIKAVGTLLSNESAIIRPEIAGIITQIAFTEGQPVKAGDVLLQLDESLAKAEYDQAKANYDLSVLTYKRTQELQKKGASSEQARDEAAAQLKEKEAELALVKARLDKTTIRAPFDGIIGLREVSEGDYLQVGQVITHLESVDPMKVEFSAPEKYAAILQTDQPVMVSVDAYPGVGFKGSLFAVAPKVDPDMRVIRAKASVPNPEAKLRPGMFAYVNVVVAQKEALLIPEEALIPKGKEFSVFKVVDGKAVPAVVTIGQRQNGKVEITSGLAVGDTVVTAGHMKLRPDAPVTIQEGSGTVGQEPANKQ